MTERDAWAVVTALRAHLRDRGPLRPGTALRLDDRGALREAPPARAWLTVDPERPCGWSRPDGGATCSAAAAQLLDLYVPLCVSPRAPELVVAHLAQSLDGRIATASGVSQFISGPEDLLHTHRLRALFDAVVVGASTVAHDDPRLTTRLCSGDDPARVVIDPQGRLGPQHRLVREGPAPTVLVRRAGLPAGSMPDHVEVLELESLEPRRLGAADILAALRARGLRRIFVEGGGVTVSRFLEAGQLDRLQLSVSPVILGSGRASFTLPEILDLDGARRLDARTFTLGADVLFDCPLVRGAAPPAR